MSAALQTAVTCSWCGSYCASRPDSGHCDNCGGPLPPPTGVGARLGPVPPAAPRSLPATYRRGVMFSRNVFAIVGLVFLLVGTPFLVTAGILLATRPRHLLVLILVFALLGAVFLLVGAPLWLAGRSRGRRRLAALEHGVPAEGELVSIEQDFTVSINGRSPWLITYTFNGGGGPVSGTAQSWSPTDGQRRPGDRTWVVYLATDPQTNTLWPPTR